MAKEEIIHTRARELVLGRIRTTVTQQGETEAVELLGLGVDERIVMDA
jgi:hypothetical protein